MNMADLAVKSIQRMEGISAGEDKTSPLTTTAGNCQPYNQ